MPFGSPAYTKRLQVMEMLGISDVDIETQWETEIVATNTIAVPVPRDTNKTYLINVRANDWNWMDPINGVDKRVIPITILKYRFTDKKTNTQRLSTCSSRSVQNVHGLISFHRHAIVCPIPIHRLFPRHIPARCHRGYFRQARPLIDDAALGFNPRHGDGLI